MKKIMLLFAFTCFLTACRNTPSATRQEPNELAGRLTKIGWNTRWEQVAAIPLQFDAYHTQGIVKIGDYFYLTAVNVKRWPQNSGEVRNRQDYDRGEGTGHLFKFDAGGNLVAEMRIDEGGAFHPGGIDYDGRYIWVPVTEYLPKSFSIIYKVNPETMTAEKVFSIDDSIGAIVHDTDNHTLVGVNWDARDFYRWTLNGTGQVTNAGLSPEELRTPNPSWYIAAQDGQYIGGGLMLCSGLKGYRQGDVNFKLGGWDIINLRDFRMVHQVPVRIYTPSGNIITNNPCTVELTERGVRAYFVPEDNYSTLYIYDILTGKE